MAGRIPQSFINDLIARVDIVDLIDRRVRLKKAGKDYKACCPFHEEKTPSFTVSQQKQMFHCFGCGVSGSVLSFLMEYDRLEFVPAVEALAAIVGIPVPRENTNTAPERSDGHLYAVMDKADQFFRSALKDHPVAIDYLKARGVAGITARDFCIGFAPPGWNAIATALADVPETQLLELGLLTRNDNGRVYDKFRERIMFPIRDTRGRVVGFGGRIIGAADGPKYLNSPETPIFHKGQELYGLYEARKSVRKLERLIVVEGYLDVVSMAQAGIPYCVAALGTAISTEQMRKLFRSVDEVVCCFDGDRAGRQAAWRALEASLPVITDGKRLQFVFLPDTEDPDSFVRKNGKDAFLRQLQGASPVVEYLFSTLSQGLNLASIDDRARLAGLAMPQIEKVQEGILRQMMLEHLSRLTGSQSTVSALPQRPAPERVSARRPSQSRLEERLLAILLRYPQVALGVMDEDLPTEVGSDAMLALLRYARANPDAMTDELLAMRAGQPDYENLIRLASQPLVVENDERLIANEFCEGLKRLTELGRRGARRAILVSMQADPNREYLSELVKSRRQTGGKPEFPEEPT